MTLTSPEVNIESAVATAKIIIINFRLSTIKVANLRILKPQVQKYYTTNRYTFT